MAWDAESIFHSAEDYYASLFQDVTAAQVSVDIETYIFSAGRLTDEFFVRLGEIAQRGVRIRLVVDGVGAWLWLQNLPPLPDGIELRVYHPLYRLRWLNRRNHKKVCVIDERIAYVGSTNLTDESFQWRETGVMVRGPEIQKLSRAFEWVWLRSKRMTPHQQKVRGARKFLRSRHLYSEDITLNHSIKLRRRAHKTLLERLKNAQTRVWITNPYFVPTRRQRAVLRGLKRRGVDVKILIPGPSDLPWMRPLTYFFLRLLQVVGVEIYEYRPRVLHAKISIIDDYALIGSSNWNHRSWHWDLEVDIRIMHAESLASLIRQFHADLRVSAPLDKSLSLMWRVVHFLAAPLLYLLRNFL